jgi:hypothetical protein
MADSRAKRLAGHLLGVTTSNADLVICLESWDLGAEIVPTLPAVQVPRIEFVHACIGALVARGVVAEFLRHLGDSRSLGPGQREAWSVVATDWGIAEEPGKVRPNPSVAPAGGRAGRGRVLAGAAATVVLGGVLFASWSWLAGGEACPPDGDYVCSTPLGAETMVFSTCRLERVEGAVELRFANLGDPRLLDRYTVRLELDRHGDYVGTVSNEFAADTGRGEASTIQASEMRLKLGEGCSLHGTWTFGTEALQEFSAHRVVP